jgi:hypothetical protein
MSDEATATAAVKRATDDGEEAPAPILTPNTDDGHVGTGAPPVADPPQPLLDGHVGTGTPVPAPPDGHVGTGTPPVDPPQPLLNGHIGTGGTANGHVGTGGAPTNDPVDPPKNETDPAENNG